MNEWKPILANPPPLRAQSFRLGVFVTIEIQMQQLRHFFCSF